MPGKKMFGYNNISKPKIIISDESWVFIIAALKEFNTETLQDFLLRASEYCSGKNNIRAYARIQIKH